MAAAAAAPPPVKDYEIEVNLSLSPRLCGAGESWSRLWILGRGARGRTEGSGKPRGCDIIWDSGRGVSFLRVAIGPGR